MSFNFASNALMDGDPVIHWRTVGSKNGVRLWQNKDGSYTEAGRNSKPGGRYNTRGAYGTGSYHKVKSEQGTIRRSYVTPKEFAYSSVDRATGKMSNSDYAKVIAKGVGSTVLTAGAIGLVAYGLYKSPEIIAAIKPYLNKDAAAMVNEAQDWGAKNADAIAEMQRAKEAYDASRAATRAAGGSAEFARQAAEDADRIIDMQFQMERAADFAKNPGAYSSASAAAKRNSAFDELDSIREKVSGTGSKKDAFAESVEFARKVGVPEDRIIKNKEELDAFFGGTGTSVQEDVDELMSAIEAATPQQRAAAADTLAGLEKKMGAVNVSPAANLGVRRDDYDSWDDYWKAYQKASDEATDRYYSGLRTAEQALKNTSGDEATNIDAALDALLDMFG